MLPRLLTFWERIRTSLWAAPSLMICAAIVTAIVAVNTQIGQRNDPVWFLYSGSARDAPEFLSNLVTAMMTMATLAISITMVVLTLAAQQLGPRLIRIFMRSRTTQLALGLFISTAVYLLLVLRSVSGASDLVPNLAVTIGTAFAMLSIIMLLFFVHHLARSIIADTVVEEVGEDLDFNAARLLSGNNHTLSSPASADRAGSGAVLRIDCEGYLQAIDHSRLVEAAEKNSARIELDVRPGHHLIAGTKIGAIFPAHAASSQFRRKIAASLLTGSGRTPVQDMEYSIREMVELAVRALSPGVNDPFTAIVTIDRLTLSLSRIMRLLPAKSRWTDKSGVVRLTIVAPTLGGLLDASFNMVRQYGADSPAVLICLAANLAKLFDLAEDRHRDAIRAHLEMVRAAGRRSIREPRDLDDLEMRVAPVLDPERTVSSAAG